MAGTFIILASNILSYRNKINIKNKEKFSLVSQMIGFLFLFNSFLYQLYPKITELELIFIQLPITEFSYWPYYCFIIVGIFISLILVREKDFGWGLEVSISPKSQFELWLFLSPAIFAGIALFLNEDFLLIVNIFTWFYFMGMLWKRD